MRDTASDCIGLHRPMQCRGTDTASSALVGRDADAVSAGPSEEVVRPMQSPTLRPYQREAVAAVREAYMAGHRSTLLVLPTGCGKTVVFAEVMRRTVARGRRGLILAHRTELLEQALAKLLACGVRAEIEQGDRRAGADAECVVASVQTLRGPRLERWAPDSFDLVVIDEAHHAVAAGYAAILGRFATARVLGVTATPDRLDGQGMGRVFDSVAFTYGIRDAIRDRWLAPIRARRVAVDGLDLAGIHTRAGDFATNELAEVMANEAALHGVAVPLLEQAGDRRTIVFAVDVAHAKALAAVLSRYRPNVARAVDGSMSATERASILGDFAAGRFQMLVNVALLTEGYDCPPVSCIAMARPTKSRALYTQCVGRGTRLHPGKADCLVLDFVGNAGRHRLVGPADVLADGDVPEDVRELVEGALSRSEADVDELLDSAADQVEAKRKHAAITAVARYSAIEVDPFLGDDLSEMPSAQWANDLATDAQRESLAKAGLENLPLHLSKGTASRWLDAIARRRSEGLCTFKQVRLLARHGINAKAMSFAEAGERIARLKERWRQQREAA